MEKAKEKFKDSIDGGKLLVFNVGLGMEEGLPMPLWYKFEGSVTSSFVKNKGCSGLQKGKPCLHTDVEVIHCNAILDLIKMSPEIWKVDIEMLHHVCVRSLSHSDPKHLPKYVCWEEHDKPFGSSKTQRPITDMKLILGMYELGYDEIKVVMAGRPAPKWYGAENKETAKSAGQNSGSLKPEEHMDYLSFESSKDGKFNRKWVSVDQVVNRGLFRVPARDDGINFQKNGMFFDVCMKKALDAEDIVKIRKEPENFPLGLY